MKATNVQQLSQQVVAGNRRALAKAITLLEGNRPDQRQAAAELLRALMPASGRATRVAISGPPGVGKSTFIEALGRHLLTKGLKLAVLAIDPTSPLSGGSILGDRTRMEALSRDARVFIRPSPTGGTLGGVTRRTREAIIACEAGGYDIVIVETVGVGQSEMMAASMVDAFLLLHLPNAGDELQGIKKGILELADIVAVTKADGNLLEAAKLAKAQLEQALGFAQHHEHWRVPIITTSSQTGSGIAAVWQAIEDFTHMQKNGGRFISRRQRQALQWFHDELGVQLQEALTSFRGGAIKAMESRVVHGEVPGSVAASEVIAGLFSDAQYVANKT